MGAAARCRPPRRRALLRRAVQVHFCAPCLAVHNGPARAPACERTLKDRSHRVGRHASLWARVLSERRQTRSPARGRLGRHRGSARKQARCSVERRRELGPQRRRRR
eukprot:Amastigsp_a858965_13.p3 type:complete len:107 gc:universal Amastigsp_a858965_13:717-397(-)